MIIDAYATDTTPSYEVRRRALEALASTGEPMSEVTYDALRKRLATAEAEIENLRAALHKLRVEYFELSSKKADEIGKQGALLNKLLQENRTMEKKIEKAAAIIINARAVLGEKE